MKREQKSSVLGVDTKQQKKDNAKLAKVATEEKQKVTTENNNYRAVSEPESEVVVDDDNSDTYSFKSKKAKVDKKDIFLFFILLSVNEHFATGDDLRSPHRHSCPRD